MKKILFRAFTAITLLAMLLMTTVSCAPPKLQGSFNGSFSLTDFEDYKDGNFRYTFYGDGQGVEVDRTTGRTVSFSYTAFDGKLTIETENKTHTYTFRFEKENIDITFLTTENEKKSILLTKA